MEVEKLIQLLNQRSVTPEIQLKKASMPMMTEPDYKTAFIYKINVPRALTEA